MPLRRGKSNAVKSQNIQEMRAAGRPQNQAVAAAMNEADNDMANGDKSHMPSAPKRRFTPGKFGQKFGQ